MGKRKPWCVRASRQESHATIEEKHALKHAPRLMIGGWLELMAVTGSVIVVAVSSFHSIKMWIDGRDDPLSPNALEAAIPVVIIGVSLGIVVFVVGLLILESGKRRLKEQLLPIRCQRCPKCFYDLSARPRDDDTCPECGMNAPRRECVRMWCKLLRSRF